MEPNQKTLSEAAQASLAADLAAAEKRRARLRRPRTDGPSQPAPNRTSHFNTSCVSQTAADEAMPPKNVPQYRWRLPVICAAAIITVIVYLCYHQNALPVSADLVVAEVKGQPIPEIKSHPVPESESHPVPEVKSHPVPEDEIQPCLEDEIPEDEIPEDETHPVPAVKIHPIPEIKRPCLEIPVIHPDLRFAPIIGPTLIHALGGLWDNSQAFDRARDSATKASQGILHMAGRMVKDRRFLLENLGEIKGSLQLARHDWMSSKTTPKDAIANINAQLDHVELSMSKVISEQWGQLLGEETAKMRELTSLCRGAVESFESLEKSSYTGKPYRPGAVTVFLKRLAQVTWLNTVWRYGMVGQAVFDMLFDPTRWERARVQGLKQEAFKAHMSIAIDSTLQCFDELDAWRYKAQETKEYWHRVNSQLQEALRQRDDPGWRHDSVTEYKLIGERIQELAEFVQAFQEILERDLQGFISTLGSWAGYSWSFEQDGKTVTDCVR